MVFLGLLWALKSVFPIKVELFFSHGKMNIGVVFVLAWGYMEGEMDGKIFESGK